MGFTRCSMLHWMATVLHLSRNIWPRTMWQRGVFAGCWKTGSQPSQGSIFFTPVAVKILARLLSLSMRFATDQNYASIREWLYPQRTSRSPGARQCPLWVGSAGSRHVKATVGHTARIGLTNLTSCPFNSTSRDPSLAGPYCGCRPIALTNLEYFAKSARIVAWVSSGDWILIVMPCFPIASRTPASLSAATMAS